MSAVTVLTDRNPSSEPESLRADTFPPQVYAGGAISRAILLPKTKASAAAIEARYNECDIPCGKQIDLNSRYNKGEIGHHAIFAAFCERSIKRQVNDP